MPLNLLLGQPPPRNISAHIHAWSPTACVCRKQKHDDKILLPKNARMYSIWLLRWLFESILFAGIRSNKKVYFVAPLKMERCNRENVCMFRQFCTNPYGKCKIEKMKLKVYFWLGNVFFFMLFGWWARVDRNWTKSGPGSHEFGRWLEYELFIKKFA